MSTAEKRDGLGNRIDPRGFYFIQDTRTVVGNCASWWRPDGKGYTCDIGDAGVYLGSKVLGMQRETDVPWPEDAVLRLVLKHVRVEPLDRLARGESVGG